jgi:hypothetical protein
MQRKFKVSTTITQYMWASSREDAAKFQEELIQKGKLDALRHGATEVKFCFVGGDNFLEAPEDISKTRNPADEPRRGDWLEIGHDDVETCALVRRLTRRKVYYYEGCSRTERSVDREQWKRWADVYAVHPSYDGIVPPFIVDEAIEEHEKRKMLSGISATPDSSLILEILDKYGYVPDDYEVENGYWAEIYIDQAVSERIMANQSESDAKPRDPNADPESADFSVGFSEELPTVDDLDLKF